MIRRSGWGGARGPSAGRLGARLALDNCPEARVSVAMRSIVNSDDEIAGVRRY